jgi:hypothetical protein
MDCSPRGRVEIWEEAGERATSSFPVNPAHICDALTGPFARSAIRTTLFGARSELSLE